jgi:hypothetical protein
VIIIKNLGGETTYSDDEFEFSLHQVEKRYSKALDAGDSKRRGTEQSYYDLTDSVSDIPWLINVIRSLDERLDDTLDELCETNHRLASLEK